MCKVNYEELIGKNIKKERIAKGWTQAELASNCGIASTVISSYENGRATPGLNTALNIASELGITVDRLCYGDESEALISRPVDEGKKIANCVAYLVEKGILNIFEREDFYKLDSKREIVYRLIKNLVDFNRRKSNYTDPQGFREQIIDAAAHELNTSTIGASVPTPPIHP